MQDAVEQASWHGLRDQEAGRPMSEAKFRHNPEARRAYEQAYDRSRTEEMMEDYNWVGSRHHY